MKHQINIINDQTKSYANSIINAIDCDSNMMIEIKKRTRTLDQNSRLHAMLTDVSRQLAYRSKSSRSASCAAWSGNGSKSIKL